MDIIISPEARLEQLKNEGYCLIDRMADDRLLNKTRACVDKALAAVDAERRASTRAPGSLLDSYKYPELADLIGNPPRPARSSSSWACGMSSSGRL